jgi:hypothetical protein
MADTATIFLVGFFVFLAGGVFLFGTYIFYILRSQAKLANLKCADAFSVCLTTTRWLYPVFFTSLFLLAALYMSMYLNQGISARPNLLLVMWERWVILGVIGFLYAVCLNYYMTILSHDEQSFFMVIFYTLSYWSLLGAALSQTTQTRVLWLVVSIVAAILAILFYVYPDNKFACHHHITTRFAYYKFFFAVILIAYAYYILIFILAASNELTSAISFQGEAIAYLVGDALFVLLFALVLAIATFVDMKDTLRVKNPVTGRVTYQSKPMTLNSNENVFADLVNK